jgi:two-component system cell cycle sensor histidine kinase/response regulator CckA
MSDASRKPSDDLEVFFNASSDLLAIADFNGMLIHVNAAWTLMLGFTEEELLSTTYVSLIHPDDQREAVSSISPFTQQSKGLNFVARFRTTTNSHRLLHCSVVSDLTRRQIYLSAREMPGWREGAEERTNQARRIAEQMRGDSHIEEALRHTVETVTSIIVSCPHAIIAVDRNRNVRIWNPAATRIFGWTDEEVVGNRVPFVTEDQQRSSDDFNDRAMQGEVFTNHEVQRNRRDGTVADLLVSAGPTYDIHGVIDGFITVTTDITEHKKLEQQFLRTQRMESIGTIAGGVAHDLNNVLAPIQMSLELLRMKSTDPSINRTLDTLQSCVKRGADLIRQILTFARGVKAERAPLQTRNAVRDMHKVVVETMPKSINITSDVPTDLWNISADMTQVHQVLMNLCINARDAMPEGGTLSICAGNVVLDEAFVKMSGGPATGPHVFIEIRDSGSGIPAEIRERIFEPFFTTKGIDKGTGLGLSTVAAIVKSHGGFINLYSEVGRGTSFKVYLPALTTISQQQVVEALKTLPVGNGELILVVDDEAAVRDIAALTLESHGYRVLQAQDGADGVARYAQNLGEIKLVISDMDMPVMNGAAMIRSLERIDPNVRVLSASGLVGGPPPAQSPQKGRKVLPKPYTAEQLLNAVHDLIVAA